MSSEEERRSAIKSRIKEHGLSGKPAEAIVTMAGRELWMHSPASDELITALCENFYDYGRVNNWIWQPSGSSGCPLVRGEIHATNCGSFNANVRWLAEKLLDVPTTIFKVSATHANHFFITNPKTVGIDPSWPGNVCTINADFNTLGAYFFKSHSFSNFKGNMYDASTSNYGFDNASDLMWCTLALVNEKTKLSQGGRAFMVTNTHGRLHEIPGPPPYACIEISLLKRYEHFLASWSRGSVSQSFIRPLPVSNGSGSWPTFLLVSREHVPHAFLRAVNLP